MYKVLFLVRVQFKGPRKGEMRLEKTKCRCCVRGIYIHFTIHYLSLENSQMRMFLCYETSKLAHLILEDSFGWAGLKTKHYATPFGPNTIKIAMTFNNALPM